MASQLEKGEQASLRLGESVNLDELRKVGDAEVDEKVAKTFANGEDGRKTYNRILSLVSLIIEEPGRLLVRRQDLWERLTDGGGRARSGRNATHLDKFRMELLDLFMPAEAPAWVDPDKLRMASQLWSDYTIPCMGVLYAASLPYCYLIKRGIPALYDTRKLLEPYLSQRIYETGLFLEAVMDPRGLEIIVDRTLDPESEAPARGRRSRATKEGSKRYLWGRGYLTAKKVRFLHASMRYMLLHPDAFRRKEPVKDGDKTFGQVLSERPSQWDTEGLGIPVNQEDLAYTLLTFGLVIPKGLERWGVAVSREQKEAFLHHWAVVGHIMGIREELITDSLDEAECLFRRVQTRQAGGSPDGMALTMALVGVLEQYLPKLPMIPANTLPVQLMRSQIGEEYADALIDKYLLRTAREPWRRPLYALLDWGAGAYFLLRGKLMRTLPMWGEFTTGILHEVGEAMISAWRDAYRRQPFFVPDNPSEWERERGATEAFLRDLKAWRQKVLGLAALALVFLVIGMVPLALSLPLLIFSGQKAALIALGLALLDWVLFVKIARAPLQTLLASRPQLRSGSETPGGSSPPVEKSDAVAA